MLIKNIVLYGVGRTWSLIGLPCNVPYCLSVRTNSHATIRTSNECTSWWRHDVTTRKHISHYWFFVRGTPSVTGGFPHKWPVMWSFFVVSLHKRLSKQSNYRSFETPWGSCDVIAMRTTPRCAGYWAWEASRRRDDLEWHFSFTTSTRSTGIIGCSHRGPGSQALYIFTQTWDVLPSGLVKTWTTRSKHDRIRNFTGHWNGNGAIWWNVHHWLHWKLSFWQLSVQPMINISSKWHFGRSCDGRNTICMSRIATHIGL